MAKGMEKVRHKWTRLHNREFRRHSIKNKHLKKYSNYIYSEKCRNVSWKNNDIISWDRKERIEKERYYLLNLRLIDTTEEKCPKGLCFQNGQERFIHRKDRCTRLFGRLSPHNHHSYKTFILLKLSFCEREFKIIGDFRYE